MASPHIGSLRGRAVAYGLASFVVAVAVCGASVLQHGSAGSVSRAAGRTPDPCAGALELKIAKDRIAKEFRFPQPPMTNPQSIADCEAWQDFIYVNWPADPDKPGYQNESATAADFGKRIDDPAQRQVTVWESYATGHQAFAGSKPALPATRPMLRLSTGNEFLGNKVVTKAAKAVKVAGGAATAPETINQATGGWLTSQSKLLVFYDAWVDNDEFDYINDPDNKLKTGPGQKACAQGTAGLQLPMPKGLNCAGAAPKVPYGLGIGAMEVKAAFLDLSNSDRKTWSNYLLSAADLCYPNTFKHPDGAQKCTFAVDGTNFEGWVKPNTPVGLVGLHIVHKVVGADQFLWETFEHVNNVPDTPGSTHGGFDFYSPGGGTPQTDAPEACTSPNDPAGCTPFDTPAQLVRHAGAAFDDDAKSANADFAKALADASPKSVFANYRLVQVQWPTQNTALVPGAKAPLPATLGGVVPAQSANTVIESFGQDTSCINCHRGARISTATALLKSTNFNAMAKRTHESILIDGIDRHGRGPRSTRLFKATGAAPATPVPQPVGPPYAADYSFLFKSAGG